MVGIPNDDGELAGLRVLRDFGYVEAEEVFYAAQALGPELSALTGVAPVALQARLAGVMALLPAATKQELDELRCPLGVPAVGAVPLADLAGPVPPKPAAQVNLITQLPPIRNQGDRGTCVAHASVAVLEQSIMAAGAPEDLSEQFLYWDCKQNDGQPDKPGTWLRIAFSLIARDGVCPEAVWPYESAIGPREDGGDPPVASFADALPYRHAVRGLPQNSLLDIKASLSGGRCVAFSIPVFRSWYRSSWVRAYGKINMPLPNDILEGGHAMAFVGYEDSDEAGTGGGRFILRNSWGPDWAAQSPYEPGYGSIPYAYIERHCMEAYTLE